MIIDYSQELIFSENLININKDFNVLDIIWKFVDEALSIMIKNATGRWCYQLKSGRKKKKLVSLGVQTILREGKLIPNLLLFCGNIGQMEFLRCKDCVARRKIFKINKNCMYINFRQVSFYKGESLTKKKKKFWSGVLHVTKRKINMATQS